MRVVSNCDPSTRCHLCLQDNVFVNVVISVQYQVIRESLYDAFYKLTVGGNLQDSAEGMLAGTCGEMAG